MTNIRKKGIISFIMAFVLLLGVFAPMTTVQAASDYLVENMDKYHFYADTNERTLAINSSIKAYGNASDAVNARNEKTTYPAGKYYIYKAVKDSINISRQKGSAGAWVNLNQLKAVSAEKIKTYQSINVYGNAANATNKVKATSSYATGTYYVYKSVTGSKNITKTPGSPGGWVNLKDLSSAVTLRKPDYKLISATKVYSNAADAMAGSNAKTTYAAGDYYIYKTYQNAINISKVYGKPGAWIASNMVTLKAEASVYPNADYAVKSYRPSATYAPGGYFIYKETSSAVNITTTKEKPGGWISKTALQKATQGLATIVETVDKTKPAVEIVNDFRIVLDAGHGPNDNRGGVLFDEGRQNFLFMEKIIAELKKYPGVEILLTRDSMNENPSLVARATEHSGADVFLSIHTNAWNANTRGVEIYGSKDNSKEAMAKEITKTFANIMDTYNRGLKYRDYYSGAITSNKSTIRKDYYGVMRGNDASEKLLIETVFHTNYADSKAYLDNQEALAKALVDIFAKYYGLKK